MAVPRISIRPMRPDDAEEVRRLDQLILGEDRSQTWDDHVTRFIELSDYGALPHPSLSCFVAHRNNRVIGFLLSELQAGEYGLPRGMWIVAVGVHPDERRQGIGRLLVDELRRQCVQRGIEDLYAVLRPDDSRIAAFLASCGLEQSAVTVMGQRVSR
ncbi:MAG: GNAT family N-acetyltransferase [Chloroflexi bacterium]|nr:GNAT family N-acetyltransferase [Chloroflexota bacterium]